VTVPDYVCHRSRPDPAVQYSSLSSG
jgi:hypothetical protein